MDHHLLLLTVIFLASLTALVFWRLVLALIAGIFVTVLLVGAVQVAAWLSHFS